MMNGRHNDDTNHVDRNNENDDASLSVKHPQPTPSSHHHQHQHLHHRPPTVTNHTTIHRDHVLPDATATTQQSQEIMDTKRHLYLNEAGSTGTSAGNSNNNCEGVGDTLMMMGSSSSPSAAVRSPRSSPRSSSPSSKAVTAKASAIVSAITSNLFRRRRHNRKSLRNSVGSVKSGTVPLRGYLTLVVAFLAISTSGTALDLQGTDVHPCMKVYWRLSATSLALIPFVLYSLHKDGPPRLSFRQWLLFPCAALAYSEMTTSFVKSLSLTSIANTFVFSNMTSLILLCVNALLGRPTLFLEVTGVIIGFIGALICSGDESRHSSAVGHDSLSTKRFGDLLALSASFGMAAYLSIAKDLQTKCNLFVFTFALFVCSQFFVLSFMIVQGEPVEFSTNKNYGMFGWTNSDPNRLPVELYIVLVCSLMGTVAYVAVLKYFSAVVVATVMLMEPSVAALSGYMAGVDTLPGLQTWIGDAFVIVGSTLVIYCGATKDATKAKHRLSNKQLDSPGLLPHVHDQ